MIGEWSLARFKAVDHPTTLQFGDVTVFVGANSSGKSTWIQSMLLVAQTLSSQLDSYSVILNGSLAKLGQFNDILSATEGEPAISIGCKLQENAQLSSSGEDMNVECMFTFDANPESPNKNFWQVRPRLLRVELKSNTVDLFIDDDANVDAEDNVREITLTRNLQALINELPSELSVDIAFPLRAPDSSAFQVQLDEESQDELKEEIAGARPIGCVFNHFLPRALTVEFDRKAETVKFLYRQLTEQQRIFRVPRHLSEADLVFPEPVLRLAFGDAIETQPLLFEDSKLVDKASLSARDIAGRLRQQPIPIRSRTRANVSSRSEEILKLLMEHVTTSDGQTDIPLSGPLDAASRYLAGWFRAKFRYLGPLRDDPRAQYPLSAVADPKDVGLRGEHTAAVLHFFRDVHVPYLRPSEGPFDNEPGANVYLPLHNAVEEWLQYLEIAEHIETDDQGKQGHGMRVQFPGSSRLQDLTHVGVGVSQVLPILVMALLAEVGTCLVFEQPEIHLHPKVQGRLADFFLAMASLKKQCIIETHSEYLINRMRLRAASDPSDNTSDRIKVYFAEKHGLETSYRSVSITPYGAVFDWPKGFFDESQTETERIIRAAMEKRKREGDASSVRNMR